MVALKTRGTLCIAWLCAVLTGCSDAAVTEPPEVTGSEAQLVEGAPFVWRPPTGFNPEADDLGLPPLAGPIHYVVYDPTPSNAAERGFYESLTEGTFNHHPKFVVYRDHMIVNWTNHAQDENGPGQRVLARVGRLSTARDAILWGEAASLAEVAPPPVVVAARKKDHPPDVVKEIYVSGTMQVRNGRLYFVGEIVAVHGWTDDKAYSGRRDSPVPAENYQDRWSRDFRLDIWWKLGVRYAQQWDLDDGALVPVTPMFVWGDLVDELEITPGKFKDVGASLRYPYQNAPDLKHAPAYMRDDVLHGPREVFHRKPKYAPGTAHLAADGADGLAHMTEYRTQDGQWVAIRDNLKDGGHYFAVAKEHANEPYPPAYRTNLFGDVQASAGELPDGRPWIIGNDRGRTNMYITLSNEGYLFDQTWSVRSLERAVLPGVHKSMRGGPQYFMSATLGETIWVVYSVGKEDIELTAIPASLFDDPDRLATGHAIGAGLLL